VNEGEPIFIHLGYPMYKQDYRPRSIIPKGSRFTVERRPTDRIYRVRLEDGPKPKDWPDLTRWLDRLQKDEQ
jgi:hypothetical protein